MGYLDGTIAAPAKLIPSLPIAGPDLVSNPAYDQWYDQDQQVLSGLLSSMSEEILYDVVAATTFKEAWDTLQRIFSSSTRARTVQIRVELATSKKRDLSAANYFHKIKGLATELAAAGSALQDDDVIAYLLAGLGPDYDPFVTSMTTKSEALTLDDVFAHLMTFEARQLQPQAELQLNPGSSTNYVGHGGEQKNYGRRDRGRGRSQGGAPSRPAGDRHDPSTCPSCQICGKVGHTAIRCWHRMDESYQDEPSSTPSAALTATFSYKIDPNWYNDIGASDHITSDLDRLAVREHYHGGEQVQVDNGAGLRILHTGHSLINTIARPLALRNILHVPEISKHLFRFINFLCGVTTLVPPICQPIQSFIDGRSMLRLIITSFVNEYQLTSKDQLVDIMTKPLSVPSFSRLRHNLNLHPPNEG